MRIYALSQELRFLDDKEVMPIDAMEASTNVPMVDCPACGRGWGSSLRYPFFRPDKNGSLPLKKLWRRRHDYDAIPRDSSKFWAWLEEFRRVMANECPRVTFINPGVGFGLLRVSVAQEVDLASPGCGAQLVARDSVVKQLQSQGMELEPCPTLLRRPRDRSSDEYLELNSGDPPNQLPTEPYRELFARPCARKADTQSEVMCPKCLRFDSGWDWTGPMPVSARSIPLGVDLFRVLERPAAILATERFVRAVEQLRTWEVSWQEVEVVD